MTERLVVGRIVKPHGVRGEVVVEPQTEALHERFAAGVHVSAGDPLGTPGRLKIVSVRPSNDWLIVHFAGVNDRDRAEGLRGALLSIPAADAVPPPPDRYYPHQLEGLDVVDEAGDFLGVLAGVEDNPANDLWIVRKPDGSDVLVPAVKEFVRSVDLAARRIVIRPIPGLFEGAEE